MYKRLYTFLEEHGTFSSQFGLCNGHSTGHALVNLTEHIIFPLDINRLGCGIFIDLQKAFDTVNQIFS